MQIKLDKFVFGKNMAGFFKGQDQLSDVEAFCVRIDGLLNIDCFDEL